MPQTNAITIHDLDDKQERAARLLAQGKFKIFQIAQILGVVPATISRWVKIPQFNAYVEEVRATRDVEYAAKLASSDVDLTQRMLMDAAPVAMQKIMDITFGEKQTDEKFIVENCRDILDRSGHGKSEKKTQGPQINMNKVAIVTGAEHLAHMMKGVEGMVVEELEDE